MRTLSGMYHPITGTPFQADETYREVAPCAALAPYIRCFWGSDHPLPARPHEGGVVIPDTCMDIIFHIDYAANRIGSVFCGLDEHSDFTGPSDEAGGLSATFAIRFYAWTACLFSDNSLAGTINGRFPAEAFFGRITRALAPRLSDEPTLAGKIRVAEGVLLSMIAPERADPAVLCAVHHILHSEGRARIGDISAALAISPRQLERRFGAALGVSPKTLASLMRYQLLWQSMVLAPGFNALDAVDRFGYADQAHLLGDFRRRHLMSPRDALLFARK